MLGEQKRLGERIEDLIAKRDFLNTHIAELEKRLLAYELAEGRGNL